MILYWVETEDHHEDWFVISKSEEQAQKFHEDYEGYDKGDAYAKEIRVIPTDIEVEEGWASNDLLKACGGIFISEETPRVVEIQDGKYTEGLLDHMIRSIDDDRFEAIGRGRPNQTTPQHKDKN